MFRYKCSVFRKNEMTVLKTHGCWKTGIYKALPSVATLLLTLIKYIRYDRTDFQNLW